MRSNNQSKYDNVGWIENIVRNNRLSLSIGFVILLLATFSGCSGFLGYDSSEYENTLTPSNSTDTVTPTETSTPTLTRTTTHAPEYTKHEKYGYFRDGYIEGMKDSGVKVVNSTLDPENETLYISYEMRDGKNNLYTGRERENVSLRYVAAADFYLNGNVSELDKTWIPKQVNVTVITSDGELYETAYTTFERAKKMIDGEISAKRYLLEYYATIEPGPANPDYEG